MKWKANISMKDSKPLTPALLMATLLVTIGSFRDAWAYLDPGTGSYVLQLILAAALGAVLTLKMWWAKFIGLFKKGGKSAHPDRPNND